MPYEFLHIHEITLCPKCLIVFHCRPYNTLAIPCECVADFKSGAFRRICGQFSNILLCMRRNDYFWTCGVNVDTSVGVPDPISSASAKFSAMTQSVDFFYILYAKYPPYFYIRFVWRTELESIPHALTPRRWFSTRLKVMWPIMPSNSVLSADTLRDLVALTFDFWTLSSAINDWSRDLHCRQVARSCVCSLLSYEI